MSIFIYDLIYVIWFIKNPLSKIYLSESLKNKFAADFIFQTLLKLGFSAQSGGYIWFPEDFEMSISFFFFNIIDF